MIHDAAGKLKVALVGPYPVDPSRIAGGVEVVTSLLADGLAAQDGVEVHVITCARGVRRPITKRSEGGASVTILPLFGRLGNLTGYFVDVRRIRAALRAIKPDVVNVHTQLFYARACIGSGFPTVLTVHGIYFREAALEQGRARLRARIACKYDRDAVSSAKHLIFINNYAAESYREWVRTPDVRLIGVPIDDRFFEIEDREEPGRVLFAGAIGERKNPMLLLRAAEAAAEKHPELRVRMAGAVREEDCYRGCLDYVRERGLQGSVDFLGALSVEDLMQEMSRCSVFALPSRQETAPAVVAQAMAAGKPVVATSVGGVPEMLADGRCGRLVPADDDNAFAGALDELVSDSQLRRTLGTNGRHEAESRYRCGAVVKQTLAYLEEIAQGGK